MFDYFFLSIIKSRFIYTGLFVIDKKNCEDYTEEEFCKRYIPLAEQGNQEAELFIAYYYFQKFYLDFSQEDPEKETLDAEAGKRRLISEIECDSSFLNESIKWFEVAGKKGDIEALKCLEVIYSKIGESYNEINKNEGEDFITKSDNCMKRIAELGDSEYQIRIGDSYYDRDETDNAVEWYEKAAIQGEYRRVLRVADFYFEKEDFKTAFKWYKVILDCLDNDTINLLVSNSNYSDVRNSISQENQKKENSGKEIPKSVLLEIFTLDSPSKFFKRIGIIFSNGFGTDPDLEEAIKWLKYAAEAGDMESCNSIGIRYYIGSGVGVDETEAAKWFQKAAKAGCPEAQFNLGTYYEEMEDNMPKALFWYLRAAVQGNREALKALSNYTEFEDGMNDEIGLAKFLEEKMLSKKALPLISGGIIFNSCVHCGLYLDPKYEKEKQ